MMSQVMSERGLATRSSIEKTMQRVERIVDSETAALRSRGAVDFREFNNGKSQALLEFSLAVRSLEGTTLDDQLVARLRTLRNKLETNRVVLRMHLEAVREVAGVVADTIQDTEWDGTYSQHAGGGGYAR